MKLLVTQRPSYINLIILSYIFYEIKNIFLIDLIIFFFSYIYCDYWLFLLHIFLDQLQTTKSSIQFISILAKSFQEHHLDPKAIIDSNHLSDIDKLLLFSNLPCFLYMIFYEITDTNSTLIKFSLFTSILGIIASTNHYYCHAITHKSSLIKLNLQYKIFSFLQKKGFLPTNEYHKIHHIPPHECNWNFLNGNNKFLTYLYLLTEKNYGLLRLLFYFTNPISITWLYFSTQIIKRYI